MDIESNGRYDLITNGVQKVPVNVNVSSELFIRYFKYVVDGTISDFIDLYSLEVKTYTGTFTVSGFYCILSDSDSIEFMNIRQGTTYTCSKYILIIAWSVESAGNSIFVYDTEKRLLCYENFSSTGDGNDFDQLFTVSSTTLIKCNVFN